MNANNPIAQLQLAAAISCAAPLAAQVPTLGPAEAAAHYLAAVRADSLYYAGLYADAIPVFERVVRETPQDGGALYRLGRARERTGSPAGALRSYRASFEQGFGATSSTAYRIARMHAALGAPDSAVAWLERALALRYEDRPSLAGDTSFASLRDNPRFRRLAAITDPPPASREAGWRMDIDYLVEEARRMHAGPDRPAWSPAFDSAAASLKEGVGRLDDEQMLAGLRHLTTLLGDGHSGIYGPLPDSPLHVEGGALPLEMRLFSDGLFVVDAAGDARRWIGARVVRVGNVAAADLITALPRYVHHDNAMTALWLGEHHLLPGREYLRAVGAVTAGADHATLTLRMREGAEHRADIEFVASPVEFPRKLHAPDGLARPPLYLTRVDHAYWLESIPEHAALYFQFNQVRDSDEGPPLAAFADSLRRALVRSGARVLIVDVRHNNGGNNGLLLPLLRTLVWWEVEDPAHRIFVVTGRGTFSAAQNFITRVERMTDAVFVGEPSSSSPNFTGEDTSLLLPWSRAVGSISTRYWQDSDPDDRRPYIWPGVPVGLTSDDYFAGRDPALEAIGIVIGR